MLKYLVFDMDGTLIDTDNIIINIWTELLKKYYGKDYKIDIELIKTFSGPPINETFNKMFPNLNHDEIKQVYNDISIKYYDQFLEGFPNFKYILNKFYKEGYKLSIFTNKNRERSIYCLKKLNIFHLFDILVCAEDVKFNKPNPEGLYKIKEFYQCNLDEMIYIGDTLYDYKVAKNADIDVILMTMKKRVLSDNIKPYCFVDSYDQLYKEVKKYEN